MPQRVDRRTFLQAAAGAGSAMAGCFTDGDGDPQLVGPGEETTMTTKNEDIEFIILDASESFDDVEPDKSKAIAWHPDKGERWWGF